jgi:hypothetical protein
MVTPVIVLEIGNCLTAASFPKLLFGEVVYAQLGNGLSVPLTLVLALGALNRPLD